MNVKLFVVLSTLALGAATASAQPAQNQNNQQNANNGNNGNNALLQLPADVERVVAIDAYNTLIAETPNRQPRYTYFRPRHISARGLARIFGGSVITTEQLLGLDSLGNGGGFGNNGFGGNTPTNGNGNNSQQFGNQGQNFGGQGFGGQQLGSQGFGGQVLGR